jgi:NDP-sugar pyrophosphorylase family protein
MNIVVAMAGRGARFREAGWAVPKPLINVLGEPMYSWALRGLPLELADKVILILSAELGSNSEFMSDLERRYAGYPLVVRTLPETTEGQACTVLAVRDLIDCEIPLIIFNSDTHQRSSSLPKIISNPNVDGALSVFQAPGEKWSFVRVDERGFVVETAEKQRISDWCSTGLYYFARGSDFVRHSKAMIADNQRVNNEFYVAPVYNRLVAQGMKIVLDVVDDINVFGTPEDLARFTAMHEGPVCI